MTSTKLFLFLILFQGVFFFSSAQTTATKSSIPVKIRFVNGLAGDYSFSEKWSFPLGVETKSDGRAGCADGGFCPERCYPMLDSNMICFPDSETIFYQLLDTSHLYHTLQCQASCYEFAGSDYIYAEHLKGDTLHLYSATGIATHSSLELYIINDNCYAYIDYKSIAAGAGGFFYCTEGTISFDKDLWAKGIIKGDFNFKFKDRIKTKIPMYWKGKIYTKVGKKK